MGAFSGLLGGFGQGAADVIVKRQTQQRAIQAQKDEQTSGALLKAAEDPNFQGTYEDREALKRQYYKLQGLKDTEIEPLLGVERDIHQHLANQFGTGGSQAIGQAVNQPQGGQGTPQLDPESNSYPAQPQGQSQSQSGQLPPTLGAMPSATDLGVPADSPAYYSRVQGRADARFTNQQAAQTKVTEAQGTQEAEYARQKGLMGAAVDTMKQLQGDNPDTEYDMEIGPNGPKISQDKGSFSGATTGDQIFDQDKDAVGQDINHSPTAGYRRQLYKNGKVKYFSIPGVVGNQTLPGPDGQPTVYIRTKGGQLIPTSQGGYSPGAYVGHTTNELEPKLVPQPDGTTKVEYFPSSKTTTPTSQLGGTATPATPGVNGALPQAPAALGGSSAATPALPTSPAAKPAGKAKVSATPSTPLPKGPSVRNGSIVGGKSLSPEENIALDKGYRADGNAEDLISRVQANLPILNGMLSSGRIQLATLPNGIAQVIGRAENLSPQESQMAADMEGLAEHINRIRGALGATGFRGHDAFTAMMSQKGNLLADPQITSRILDSTKRVIDGQRAATETSYKQHGLELPEEEVPRGHGRTATEDTVNTFAKFLDSTPKAERGKAIRNMLTSYGWKIPQG